MQYAYDTTLSLVSENAKDLEHGLNEGAEKVVEWVRKNKLTLNVKKTQLLLLEGKRREAELNQVEVWLEDQVLPRSSSVRCLGVWIDDKLSWNDHITTPSTGNTANSTADNRTTQSQADITFRPR